MAGPLLKIGAGIIRLACNIQALFTVAGDQAKPTATAIFPAELRVVKCLVIAVSAIPLQHIRAIGVAAIRHI